MSLKMFMNNYYTLACNLKYLELAQHVDTNQPTPVKDSVIVSMYYSKL